MKRVRKARGVSATPVSRRSGDWELLSRTVATMPSVKIVRASRAGDVKISVPMKELGITFAEMHGVPLGWYWFWTNVVGQSLVRKHIDQFKDLIVGIGDYHTRVHLSPFSNFLVTAEGNNLEFRFHISLVHQILNEEIAEDLRVQNPTDQVQ
jgi:hypothetical protein